MTCASPYSFVLSRTAWLWNGSQGLSFFPMIIECLSNCYTSQCLSMFPMIIKCLSNCYTPQCLSNVYQIAILVIRQSINCPFVVIADVKMLD